MIRKIWVALSTPSTKAGTPAHFFGNISAGLFVGLIYFWVRSQS